MKMYQIINSELWNTYMSVSTYGVNKHENKLHMSKHIKNIIITEWQFNHSAVDSYKCLQIGYESAQMIPAVVVQCATAV
jgi:hypothetical protein